MFYSLQKVLTFFLFFFSSFEEKQGKVKYQFALGKFYALKIAGRDSFSFETAPDMEIWKLVLDVESASRYQRFIVPLKTRVHSIRTNLSGFEMAGEEEKCSATVFFNLVRQTIRFYYLWFSTNFSQIYRKGEKKYVWIENFANKR